MPEVATTCDVCRGDIGFGDAAWMVRQDYEIDGLPVIKVVCQSCFRAEAAEAERDGWKLAAGHRMELLIEREERAEAAEARIAAALAECESVERETEIGFEPEVRTHLIRRALTGG